MPPRADYWRVNSYGYPNPFVEVDRAREAWETLESFFERRSYRELKEYWASGAASRIIDAHTLESWKATFEEFGVLYVLARSDEITITPAGEQLKAAAASENLQEFTWIGVNLLLRYPLRGPRRSRGPRYETSDLLLYWFLYAAMRELGNYFWWSELTKVLCTVFQCAEAQAAIDVIRELRAGRLDISKLPLPVSREQGGFYNSLNQVAVHASMYYLLLGKANDDSLYNIGTTERRHWIKQEWLSLVDLALGGSAAAGECEESPTFIQRMPRAPDFSGNEQGYFDYMGAAVGALPAADFQVAGGFSEIDLGAGAVAVLEEGVHYSVAGPGLISGPIAILCRLGRGQRVVRTDDLEWTYLVQDKQRVPSGELQVTVRRGRPIVDAQPIQDFLRNDDA